MGRNFQAPFFLVLIFTIGIETRADAGCNAGNANWSVAETTPDADFKVDAANGTVSHSKTGLMWKQCPEGLIDASCSTPAVNDRATFDWAGALSSAVASNAAAFAGYNDWRLPSKKELESISEMCGYRPAINQNAFPGTPADNFFWSSSTYLRDPAQAWMVTSGNGATGYDSKSAAHYVRLVRGGHDADTFDLLRSMHSINGRFPRFLPADVE